MLAETDSAGVNIETIVYGVPTILLAGMILAVLWALVRPLLRGDAVRRQKRRRYRAHHDRSGNPIPPVARGICQSCQQYAAAIYYLPSGERYCKKCYPPAKGAKR